MPKKVFFVQVTICIKHLKISLLAY